MKSRSVTFTLLGVAAAVSPVPPAQPAAMVVGKQGVASVAAKPAPPGQPFAVVAGQQGGAGAAPFHFTSTYTLIATPDQVVNAENQPAPGEAGAIGHYNYGINSDLDIICYNITLMGVTGPYDSPAVTATHIHEAAQGAAGPPRIAIPNPEPADAGPEVVKRSSGCITGPFTTGIQMEGKDTGEGFRVSQIEANPAGFFTDSHTTKSVPGVVRSQMQQSGGVLNAQGAIQGCTLQVVNVGPPATVKCLN